jgi:hypothetical protein
MPHFLVNFDGHGMRNFAGHVRGVMLTAVILAKFWPVLKNMLLSEHMNLPFLALESGS